MSLLRALPVVLVCVWLSPNLHADDWVYTIRPGDELWTIARDFCGSGNRADAIAKHNGINNGAQLRAGRRINIPTAWLAFAPSSAEVRQATGSAFIRRRDSAADSRTAAKRGDPLYMGDWMVTTEGAALVAFADGSTLAVQPNSEVLFNKLTAFGPGGMVDTHLRFAYGRGNVRVTPQNRGDRFRIQMPEGIAAVRGTEFRVGHQRRDGGASNTETLEGRVVLETTARQTDLPAGFGAVARPSSVVKESLLPAPNLTAPATPIPQQGILRWPSVPDASRYIVTWAEAQMPEIAIRQDTVESSETSVNVPSGSYLVRVRGVSSNGVEGYDASTAVAVIGQAPRPQPIAQSVAGPVQFNWVYAPADAGFEITLTAQHWPASKRLSAASSPLNSELEAGVYTWQVSAPDSAASAPQAFTLRPPQPSNIVVSNDDTTVTVQWAKQANISSYVVTLNAPNGETITREVSGQQTSVTVPEFGVYRIELASVQNSLQSEVRTVAARVSRRAWWLFFVPLLI